MTTIQPISVPTKGEGTIFQIRSNGNIINPSSPQPPTFYWEVLEETKTDDITNYTTILNGGLSMDVETYNQWGENDEFIIQWACNLLNFVIV